MSLLVYGTTATPIVKHELMEIIIPVGNTATQINLLDLANLRDVHLLSLTLNTLENFGGLSPSGNAVFSQAQLQGTILTLQLYNGKQFLNQAPVENFYPFLNNGAATILNFYSRDFSQQKVNYPKSFFNTPLPLNPVAPTSILLSIWYSDPMEIEKNDSKFSFGKQQ